MWRESNAFQRLRQALVHVQTRNSVYSPPSLTVLDAHTTISAAAAGETPPFGNSYKT